jgi:hypothetical protein
MPQKSVGLPPSASQCHSMPRVAYASKQSRQKQSNHGSHWECSAKSPGCGLHTRMQPDIGPLDWHSLASIGFIRLSRTFGFAEAEGFPFRMCTVGVDWQPLTNHRAVASFLHACSSAQLQDMACTTYMAPEREDPMHSRLHSCAFGHKAPRRSLAGANSTAARRRLRNPAASAGPWQGLATISLTPSESP